MLIFLELDILLKVFIRFKSFWEESLVSFSAQSYCLQIIWILLSSCILFTSFSCLIALVKNISMVLKKSKGVDTLTTFRGNASPISMLGIGCRSLVMLRHAPSILSFCFWVFIINGYLMLSKAISTSTELICDFWVSLCSVLRLLVCMLCHLYITAMKSFWL